MARQNRTNWTPYSTATLVDLAGKGFTRRQIADKLQRSVKAVERKQHSLKYTYIQTLTFGQLVRLVNGQA
jgi:hypothetical protein